MLLSPNIKYARPVPNIHIACERQRRREKNPAGTTLSNLCTYTGYNKPVMSDRRERRTRSAGGERTKSTARRSPIAIKYRLKASNCNGPRSRAVRAFAKPNKESARRSDVTPINVFFVVAEIRFILVVEGVRVQVARCNDRQFLNRHREALRPSRSLHSVDRRRFNSIPNSRLVPHSFVSIREVTESMVDL